MLEKTIKGAVKKRLKAIGAYAHWPVQMGMGEPCLDCHGCYRGIYFAIETKKPGGKLTARQKITIDKIREAGGLVYVIDSKEQADGFLADLVEKAPSTAGAVRQDQGIVA
jgi:hypothetical protein